MISRNFPTRVGFDSMMKTLTPLFALAFAFCSQGLAADGGKPLLSITAKRQVTGSERSVRSHSDAREKVVTLRVVIQNTSALTIDGAELDGEVLVERMRDEREKIVKEKLKAVKLPTLKPNERITIDLGEINLREVEWRQRKFEETLVEWKVVCKQGETEIGKHLSSDKFTTLEKKIVPDEPWNDNHDRRPVDPRLRKIPKEFR